MHGGELLEFWLEVWSGAVVAVVGTAEAGDEGEVVEFGVELVGGFGPVGEVVVIAVRCLFR